ncbi:MULTISPECIES: DUF1127 domain-containing protein [Sodalis]|jgi:uncharacterized protein YjiS (DUF1127 family)|uniref:Uncharacterized protein YjiS (DUF1127 family) n=1 Tax=Sodalis ligni TaxID=2697027 RepID=A0A4R1NGP1_9GAMM|nr:DUF1127 domain-containing protein [Sodalis ligni]TCL04961.1 uncharacterized protein YjiS (DUF1127 family) [Sodalis ligni]
MMKTLTKTFQAVPFSLPHRAVNPIPQPDTLFRRFMAWNHRRRNRAILMQLNDDQLKDIGLSREDVLHYGEK